MATAAQIIANQANAQHCTGPKTGAGKERSSQNAVKHGLTGGFRLLAAEDAAAFDELHRGFVESWQPANLNESILVRELAETYWKQQRGRRIEIAMLSAAGIKDHADMAAFLLSDKADEYTRILTYGERLSRAYYRTLRALERLADQRRKEELQAERMAAAEAKRQAAESRQRAAEWLETFLSPGAPEPAARHPESAPASAEPAAARACPEYPGIGFVLPVRGDDAAAPLGAMPVLPEKCAA